ncbi:MAG: DNA methyltransferase [Candidatus Hodarchaeales archaeon]|jgi:DNA modification methylase
MKRITPINEALPTSGHSPMYVMHKFFARKQEDVIREYIQSYSTEGEIVLDPFCGSGVIVGEALRLGRRTVGVDINPVSIFITRNTIKYSLNIENIVEELKRIETDIKLDINSLYKTNCRKCGKEVPAICFTWKNKSLFDVRYECPQHGKMISPVNTEDIRLLIKIENGEISEFFDSNGDCHYWYPKNSLYYDDGTPFLKKERFDSVDEIFTQRNIIALAKLLDRIKKIEKKDLMDTFKFAFSSMTHLASKMTPVRPSRPFSSAWVQQSYWFCPFNMESNVWNLFERSIIGRQGLVKAKEDLPQTFRHKKEATRFKQLVKEKKYDYLLMQSSINTLEEINAESIDYVITDPPYGHSIQFGELLFLWGCWLQLMDGFDKIAKEEIITNPRQKKNDEKYEEMLHQAFRQIHRVLKPEKYCIVTFHNPSLKYRNILFRSVLQAGFEFEKIVYQPPPRPSAKSLLQPFGSQRGDYFFRFKRPRWVKEKKFKNIKPNDLENLIVNIIRNILLEKGRPTHYTEIQNELDPILYEELRKSGILMDFNPENVKKTLEKYLGRIFQIVDIDLGKKGEKQLKGKGWWLIN